MNITMRFERNVTYMSTRTHNDDQRPRATYDFFLILFFVERKKQKLRETTIRNTMYTGTVMSKNRARFPKVQITEKNRKSERKKKKLN